MQCPEKRGEVRSSPVPRRHRQLEPCITRENLPTYLFMDGERRMFARCMERRPWYGKRKLLADLGKYACFRPESGGCFGMLRDTNDAGLLTKREAEVTFAHSHEVLMPVGT